ncbi:MAG TPA: saccharopine dehydrogenase NADP-binding domain-containing protein, partial [Candidatus Desulfaltia sp.]|nr:saccharopine dehydrogenase NADP-binding domain-containing protein [Candidatus Desulfaltia sp.]
MKVLVLGVGKMGYGLLKDLDAQPHVDEIVAADMNTEQAKAYAERVGGDKTTVVKLDATDKHETVKLMKRGFDVVALALPRPFCDAAVEAAVEAGVGYADVAAGFDTIFSQHGKAEKAGITVVPHIGLDVGIDRVLCGVGARKLDHTDGLTVWCGGFPQRDTAGYHNPLRYKISWYWPYAVDSNLRTSTVLIDGETTTIKNLSDPEEITFPPPIGKTEAYTTGGLMDVVQHLGLQGVKTAVGKTVRWPGHCETWTKLKQLHLL